MMNEKNALPQEPEKARKKIAAMMADISSFQGTWKDGACKQLKAHVGKLKISWKMRVKISGRWTTWTLGDTRTMDIIAARGAAWAILAGGPYNSYADVEAVIQQRNTEEGECPSVLKAFDIAFTDRVDRGVIKEKSIKSYRPALKAAGEKFYMRTLNQLTQDEIENMAHYMRQTYAKSYFDSWRVSLDYTFQFARRQPWGVPVNLASGLSKLNFDVIDEDPEEKLDLTWGEMAALWGWLSDKRCPLDEVEIRLYKTLMMVGERIDSLCNAEWEDINLDSGWWIIPPSKRKTQKRYEKNAKALIVRLTEPLLEVMGKPDGNSKWIFPSKKNPNNQFAQGSLPIWNLFRVRDAEWIKTGRHDLVEGDPDAAWCPTNKRERNYQKRYSNFLIPEIVPRCAHHEIGRHTVATRAIELGIPGLYVSLMVGHSIEKDVPGNKEVAHSAFQNVDQGNKQSTLPVMSRTLRRKAGAAAGASKTTKRFYLHNEHSEGLEVAWYIWMETFCKNVIGKVPDSVRDAVDAAKGTDDKILDALLENFGGNLEAALQHIQAGHMGPTLHVVNNKGH